MRVIVEDLGNNKYMFTLIKTEYDGRETTYGYTVSKSELKNIYITLREIFSESEENN
jgi:hypothetical protein